MNLNITHLFVIGHDMKTIICIGQNFNIGACLFKLFSFFICS